METKEIFRNGDIFIRSLEGDEKKESRIVSGYAVKFESDSEDMGGFIEVIKKGAITEETIMNSDIYARLNHNENTVLARSRFGEGSLALELREDGLYYEFEAPHTADGDELLEHLRRGEITSSSFAFTLPLDDSGERWYRDANGILRKDILVIDRLWDVSPVYSPAYPATSCSKRSLDMVDKVKDLDTKLDSLIEDLHKYIIE